MGRIFLWDELIDSEIPKLLNFKRLVKLISQKLNNNDKIIGGIIYGSFLQGTYTLRSDLDLLVLYSSNNHKEILLFLQELVVIAKRENVPLEIISFDSEIANTSLHHIGPLFEKHLKWARENGGIIKKDPLKFFSFGHTTSAEDIKGYFRNKFRRIEMGLTKLPVMDDLELYLFLQKALELPIRTAHKVLWWRDIKIPSGSKKRILECYEKNIGDYRAEKLKKLTTLDKKYSLELKKQIEGLLNQESYSNMINEIKETTLEVFNFLRSNALLLR